MNARQNEAGTLSRRSMRKQSVALLVGVTLAVLSLGAGPDIAWAATVWTDSPDYLLRDTPHITGVGFQLGETVRVQVLHTDGTPNTGAGHDPWFVTDGGAGDLDGQVNGDIQTTWTIPQDDSAGSAFAVTALGQSSGATAQAAFTVSNFFGSIYNTIVPSPGGNPSGSDCVTQLQSDLDGSPPYGYLTFIPTGTLTFSQITNLNAVFSFPVGTYGGGSPRFEIPVDIDGDGVANGSVFVYIGTPPSFTDPGHTGFISTGNVILDVTNARWDMGQFTDDGYVGPATTTYTGAKAFFDSFMAARVLDVELVVDGGWRGDQVALVDSFTVNDKTYLTRCSAPDLSIEKTLQGWLAAGQIGTYLIRVTNVGNGQTSGQITVMDPMPIGLTYVSATGFGWDCSTSTPQNLVCIYGSILLPYQSTPLLTVRVAVASDAQGAIQNVATVSTDQDDNPENDTSTSAAPVLPPAPVPLLSAQSLAVLISVLLLVAALALRRRPAVR